MSAAPRSTAPRVIDMRCRPAYLHDFFGKTPGSPGEDLARWLNRRVGTRGDDAHFTRSRTPEGFLAEVRDAGLAHAVVVGRHTPGQHLPNDTIHAIVQGHAELIGIGAVDPVLQGEAEALAEVERAVKTLGLAGIDLEPGFGTPPRHPDDPAYFPVYDLAQQLGVPVFLMTGPTSPDLRFNDPAPVARVAQAFPRLPIVAYHGWWPNVQQAIGLAFRYDNVLGVSSTNAPTRKPSRRCSARRPECRVAPLHKRRATTQCAAWLTFPSGWPRTAASALSHDLPIARYWLRRASRIHPHCGASARGY